MSIFAHSESLIDSNELSERDRFFKAMVSRSESSQLPEGAVQLSQNLRLDRGHGAVRRGNKKLTDDLWFPNPLILPFVIPAGPLTNGQSFAMYSSGVYSDPDNDNLEYIVLASTEKATFWNESSGTIDIPFPSYETIEDEDGAMIEQANNRVYIYRGWQGNARNVTSITRSGSFATIVVPANHGLPPGAMVRIAGADQDEYNGDFEITPLGSHQFRITVDGAPDTPATGTITYRRLKRPLVWDGDFSEGFRLAGDDMPNADYGLYQANRMIQPYGRNEVVLSDILDVETVNVITMQVKAAFGSNDYTIGLHPYQENNTLVFMRKSIHLLTNVHLDSMENSTLDEVTREVGCCARRTIQTAGNSIFWLSDSGVYSMEIGQELNLVGKGLPLSEPVADWFERVNTLEVEAACAVYHNNRYYIACPLDGASRNTHLFVYNVLNPGWESVDVFPAGHFVDDLLISTWGNQRRLFATNREGAIYLMEEEECDETGEVASPTENPIPGKLWTRAYLLSDSNSLKRFSKGVVHLEATGIGDAVTISASTRNPDSVSLLKTFVATSADDRTELFRIKKRGHSLSLRIESTSGRPIIRSVYVDGTDYGYSTRSR